MCVWRVGDLYIFCMKSICHDTWLVLSTASQGTIDEWVIHLALCRNTFVYESALESGIFAYVRKYVPPAPRPSQIRPRTPSSPPPQLSARFLASDIRLALLVSKRQPARIASKLLVLMPCLPSQYTYLTTRSQSQIPRPHPLSLSLKRAPLPTSAPHQLLPLAFPIVYLASPRLAHSFSAQPAHEHQTFQNPLRVRPRLVCANYVGTVAPAPPSKTHAWIRAACNVHAGTGKLSLARLHRLCCCFLLLGETMGSLARSVTARPLEKVQIAGSLEKQASQQALLRCAASAKCRSKGVRLRRGPRNDEAGRGACCCC